MECTAKSDKLSWWRKGPCPLFSSAKNTAALGQDGDKHEMHAASGRGLDGAFQTYAQGYYN